MRGDILYSRKFNTSGVLPPDYSGVALRTEPKETPRRTPSADEEYYRPKHPVFEKDPPIKIKEPETDNCSEQSSPSDLEYKDHSAKHIAQRYGFSLEDIILAGLLLLVLNDENTDNGLLVILGLLLLAGI